LIPIILTAITCAYLVLAILVFGTRKDAYSHIAHTISELGEIGSRDQKLVAFGVFLPIAVILSAAAYFVPSTNQFQISLALCIAAGYLVATFFPCDVGSPYSGSLRQGIHNLGGGVEYAGGAISLLKLSETYGDLFQGAAVAVGLGMIAVSFENAIRGLVQRCTETISFGSLFYSLWLIQS
jgi:hypothetical protein